MIRRDYFLRLVQEMVQVLARVAFLKHHREYDQALKEIQDALRALRETAGGPGGEMGLEEWIALCRKHETAASGLMIAVADLLREEGELLALRGRPDESRRASSLALGLFLEALVSGSTFVSADLLARVEDLIEGTGSESLAPALLRRLVSYHELRGRLAGAEDFLFEWIATGDPASGAEALAFYDRLMEKPDSELEQGALPREELVSGRQEALRRMGGS